MRGKKTFAQSALRTLRNRRYFFTFTQRLKRAFFGKRKSRLFHSIFKFHGLGRTRTLIYQPWHQGRGLMDPPPPRVLDMFSISKRFCLQWKACDLLNKIMYILWVVALLETCDVTNNGRHLVFYQELEITLKPLEMAFFLCLTNNT